MSLEAKRYTLEDLRPFLEKGDRVVGEPEGKYFTNVQTSQNVRPDSLDWINPTRKNKQEMFENSQAMIVLCDESIEIGETELKARCAVVVKDPKLTFARIVNSLFLEKRPSGIHQTAFIHPEASVDPTAFIGPFTYIGKATVGRNTVIQGNCHVHDQVRIGSNVTINAGTVIGSEGFGYVRNERGELEKFPHLAGVIIEDNVDIGSNTSIDRGSLSHTIIREGAKIDNLVHIAHNVVVGRHSSVIANAMIAGSTKIGDYSWVAPSASVLQQLEIGTWVTIGVGSVVTKNVPDGETWTGVPARPLKEFIAIQNKLKNL